MYVCTSFIFSGLSQQLSKRLTIFIIYRSTQSNQKQILLFLKMYKLHPLYPKSSPSAAKNPSSNQWAIMRISVLPILYIISKTLLLMGSNNSSLPKSNWKFVRRDDRAEIYQNEFGILAEKHVLLNDPRLNEEEQISAYAYRCNSNKPIVKAYRAEYESGGDFCSHHKNMSVFIEYIPFRLVDTRNLTHEQGLYVLSESLLGFHELYSNLGAFEINDTLVGFNKDGQVRVWHNPNFAKNHFQERNLVLMSTVNPQGFDQRITSKQEEEMIEDVWAAVDQHARFNSQFRNLVASLGQPNFYNFKEVVDDEIRRLPFVPPRLKFEDKYGIVQESKVSSRSRVSGYNQSSRKWI